MLDNDHELAHRALAWTHGFGRIDRPAGATEVDFAIDMAAGGPVPAESFGRTKEAEDRLGWPPSAYWYVGTVDDAFGETVIGEWNPPLSIDPKFTDHGSAAPFDSGAFAVDPPKVSVAPDEQLDYITRHLIGLQTWHGAVRSSLESSYVEYSEYLYRQPPSPPMTAVDHAMLTDDPRAWTWEARVAKSRLGEVVGQPDQLHWRSEDRRRMVEARLEDRFDVDSSDSLLRAQAVISTRSTVSSHGDHRSQISALLLERESLVL